MSNYNPAPRAGYTKTGKSLKAVRRYYAMLNQQKTRSPEEDKLSKRIAAELRTQQDANEKRSRREGQPLLQEVQTERSELPPGVLISPKETGPVFIAPEPVAKSSHQEANKSLKSVKTVRVDPEDQTSGGCGVRFIYFLVGLLIGLIFGAVGYMLANKYIVDDHSSTVSTIKPGGPTRRPG